MTEFVENIMDDQIVDIQGKKNRLDFNEKINQIHNPVVRTDTASKKITVRKKQLFDRLNSHKLTYVKGGVCDAFIKFGYPSLDQVIDDVKDMTDQEENRMKTLLTALKKRDLKYDDRVTYYKDYIEQGTCLKTALKEGEKEWFYINYTDYLELLPITMNEDKAMYMALNRYITQNGYDYLIKNHIPEYSQMKIELY